MWSVFLVNTHIFVYVDMTEVTSSNGWFSDLIRSLQTLMLDILVILYQTFTHFVENK